MVDLIPQYISKVSYSDIHDCRNRGISTRSVSWSICTCGVLENLKEIVVLDNFTVIG